MSTTIRNVSRIFANNRTDRRVDFSRKEVRGVVMGIFWTLMVTVSLVYGAVSGRLSAVTAATLEGAAAAVELVLVMAGALCLWSGVLELMRRSGMAAGLSRLLRPVLRRLLPQAGRDEETLDALSANVSANLLGLGNAPVYPAIIHATPANFGAENSQGIIGMQMASQGDSLLVVSENGMGKRTYLEEFSVQKRGGKGVKHRLAALGEGPAHQLKHQTLIAGAYRRLRPQVEPDYR